MKHRKLSHCGISRRGGLTGGNDIYICSRCGTVTDDPQEEEKLNCLGKPQKDSKDSENLRIWNQRQIVGDKP